MRHEENTKQVFRPHQIAVGFLLPRRASCRPTSKVDPLTANLLGSPYQGRGNNNLAISKSSNTINKTTKFLGALVAHGLNGSQSKKKCVVKPVLATLFDNFLATSDLADSLAISHSRN